MKIVNKENNNQSNITAQQLIDNHNCMVFNKLHIENINRFVPSNNRKVECYGMNYIVK